MCAYRAYVFLVIAMFNVKCLNVAKIHQALQFLPNKKLKYVNLFLFNKRHQGCRNMVSGWEMNYRYQRSVGLESRRILNYSVLIII